MFTKTEVMCMNSNPLLKNCIDIVENTLCSEGFYRIYKKKNEIRFLAIPNDMPINNDLLAQIENSTVQKIHNNKIGL
tara:strand:+ start:771 stop:1001 length:231 start_codon:yes stop_codon:yes gene_type:complete